MRRKRSEVRGERREARDESERWETKRRGVGREVTAGSARQKISSSAEN